MSKDLSIIIVSYNVSPFLKLCLYSVEKAIGSLNAEVFVVDNASEDDSVKMVRTFFPDVKIIRNKKNEGFSAANNRAVASCEGEIVLLLNPDTIIPENTFKELLAFYRKHPEAAGVGVKMIDGSGNYLPESKRGLPDLMSSFFKFSGLIRFFPKSKTVAAYYAGHISPDDTAEVTVLAGAFLAFPKDMGKKCGMLDESFFMYGEDIDFSYRLSREGKNFYCPGITILHFKGESSGKSKDYVEHFYNSMLIFSKKHYFSGYSGFKKQLVTSSISTMKQIAKWTVRTDSRHKEKNTMPYSGEIFVGSVEGFNLIKEHTGISDIQYFSSFEAVDLSYKKNGMLPGKLRLFIDIRSISLHDMLMFMKENPDKFLYTFLSPDYDFYLSSSFVDRLGEITFL